MSDTATPVNTDTGQAVTAQVVDNSATLAQFQSNIGIVKANLADALQQVSNLTSQVRTQVASRDDLLSQFENEAMQMYPELTLDQIGPTLQAVDPSHPLAQLWSVYSPKIDGLNQSIQQTLVDIQTQQQNSVNDSSQLSDLIDQYQAFAANNPDVPSVDTLIADVDIASVLPQSEIGNLQVSLPALERLSPMAADMVTLQALAQNSDEDLSYLTTGTMSEEDAQGDSGLTPEQAKLAMAVNSQTMPGPSQDQDSNVSLAVSPTVVGSQPAINPWGTFIFLGALAYVFMTS